MKLDWHKVTKSVAWLSYVYAYQDFLPKWHGYQRWHRCVWKGWEQLSCLGPQSSGLPVAWGHECPEQVA
jgi:hypothetical protein